MLLGFAALRGAGRLQLDRSRNGDRREIPCYNTYMEPEILFVPSAFKHGATREDIRHAHDTRIYEGPLEGYDDKHAFIGFNLAGNPIEVFYNPIADDTIKVFHAMGCRNSVIAQLGP